MARGNGRRRDRLAGAGPSDSRPPGGFRIRRGRAPPDIAGRSRRGVEWKAGRAARRGAHTGLPGGLYTRKGASVDLDSRLCWRPRCEPGIQGSVQPRGIQAARKDAVELALVRCSVQGPNTAKSVRSVTAPRHYVLSGFGRAG